MLDASFKSAVALAADIQAKKIGCVEALEHFWARIQRFNPRVNAISVSNMGRARARARDADAAIARGESWGPLHGVPMTIKDSIDVVGMPTTWGMSTLKNNYPAANAVVVDRLLSAGAVIFAKTNVAAMLADWQTFNPIYGTTNNPWNLAMSPGGSSGGSAAALAAGLTGLEVGSDIGSSIRMPAHYCGVYGHKPTHGIIPVRGQLFPGNVAPVDFFVTGPMARSAVDLETALAIMSGPDILEASGWQLALRPSRARKLTDFKVAIVSDDPNSRVDHAVVAQLEALGSFLTQRGAKVSDSARPDINLDEAHEIFLRLLRAATSRRQTDESFQKNLHIVGALERSDQSYYARMMRANTTYHRDWLDADEIRHRMRFKWAEFFKGYDLLLCPPAATAACPHDHEGEVYQRRIWVNGASVPITDQFFWVGIAGLSDLPATVAPIGLTTDGLPVGVQIVGARYDDLACIAFAYALERDYFSFVPPPGYSD